MEKQLVSIVVPVYNVEDYIETCIKSLTGQTYKNLEIILVNDGSKDSSGIICLKHKKKDARIKVVDKKNEGPSEARNEGLRICSGKFISFLDADDYLDKDAVRAGVEESLKEDADIVIWGYTAEFKNSAGKTALTREITASGVYSKKGAIKFPASEKHLGLIGYSWNKLYRADLIKNNKILFRKDIPVGEDMLFNSEILLKAEKIVFMQNPYTHYIQRPQKTQGTFFHPNIFYFKMESCKAKKLILQNWRVEKDLICKIYNKSVFIAVKSSIKGIAREKTLIKSEKARFITNILNNETTEKMIYNFKPEKFSDKLFLILIKHRFLKNFTHILTTISRKRG